MRAVLLCAATAAIVLVQESARADEIQRGPSTSRNASVGATPIVITSHDRVRIQLAGDPARLPAPLRGQFTGSVAGLNHENLTVVLGDGEPAVIHRDLVTQLELGSEHGPRWKHTLIGAGIGLALGAAMGYASGDDSRSPEELLVEFSRAESALFGMMLLTPIGALVGAVLPAGEGWREVPLENVEWSPAR